MIVEDSRRKRKRGKEGWDGENEEEMETARRKGVYAKGESEEMQSFYLSQRKPYEFL